MFTLSTSTKNLPGALFTNLRLRELADTDFASVQNLVKLVLHLKK